MIFVIDQTNLYFLAVAVGAIIGVIIPFVATLSARGHVIAAIIMQVFAVLGVMIQSGQVVAPLFFEAMFLGYFATVTAKGSAAAVETEVVLGQVLQEMKKRP